MRVVGIFAVVMVVISYLQRNSALYVEKERRCVCMFSYILNDQ